MAYPSAGRIELPILQELLATGGIEDVRFLYDRLAGYFPRLSHEEVGARGNGHREQWRRLVQRAGRSLADKRQISRANGRWSVTAAGRDRAADEGQHFALVDPALSAPELLSPSSHVDLQEMLLDLGRVLGYYAEKEFEFYDVVWRIDRLSPRLSHVFEVQNRGNIDAALAKLKRAYDAQRSKPFLVVASERDTNRARRSLSANGPGAFHEIGQVTVVLSFEQVRRLHRALTSVGDLLTSILEP